MSLSRRKVPVSIMPLPDGLGRAERIDLTEVLTSVKDQFAGVPGIDIRIDINSKCRCFVMANELLRDVFVNLVGNAIKHSPLAINIGLICPTDAATVSAKWP